MATIRCKSSLFVKFVESTYESFKDKLRNPFYGTLVIVWVIRNREFIYKVFFHEKLTSDARLEIIRGHFLNWNSLLSFLGTVLISLGLMTLIYASLNLSRLIVQASEKTLKPLILRLFDKTSIVSRTDYLAMEKDRDYFQKKYSEERLDRIELQRELDKKVENISVDGGEIPNTSEFEREKDLKRYFAQWSFELKNAFGTLIDNVNNDTDAFDIDEYLRNDIAQFRSKNLIKRMDGGVKQRYEFTDFGKKVRDYFVQNNL